jgi:hypothetical protein
MGAGRRRGRHAEVRRHLCKVERGALFRRYDAKVNVQRLTAGECVPMKPLPPGFVAAQEPDPETGHWPGWVRVGEGPEDRWHREAWAEGTPDGTYELLGPKVQGNPEGLEAHRLLPHGAEVLPNAPRTFNALREYLRTAPLEGIVWWRDLTDPDCEKVKLKVRDFGFKRRTL